MCKRAYLFPTLTPESQNVLIRSQGPITNKNNTQHIIENKTKQIKSLKNAHVHKLTYKFKT